MPHRTRIFRHGLMSVREASGRQWPRQVSSLRAYLQTASILSKKLRERLLNSVDKIDSLNGKVANGGRLNAAKALGN